QEHAELPPGHQPPGLVLRHTLRKMVFIAHVGSSSSRWIRRSTEPVHTPEDGRNHLSPSARRRRGAYHVEPERGGGRRLSNDNAGIGQLSPHFEVQIALERAGGLHTLDAPHLQLKPQRGGARPAELTTRRRGPARR